MVEWEGDDSAWPGFADQPTTLQATARITSTCSHSYVERCLGRRCGPFAVRRVLSGSDLHVRGDVGTVGVAHGGVVLVAVVCFIYSYNEPINAQQLSADHSGWYYTIQLGTTYGDYPIPAAPSCKSV